MLTKTPPPTELQIPVTVTTLVMVIIIKEYYSMIICYISIKSTDCVACTLICTLYHDVGSLKEME